MENEKKVNILLVDDRPANLLTLETILSDLGQNLVCANSGQEALKHLLEQDFAVILLDVNMPGMDGFELAGLIRQRPRSVHTPIIFVTAIAISDMDKEKGYSLGAVDYLFAPVVPQILKAKVAVFTDLFTMQKEINKLHELKSNLLSRVSHEFRTPITIIQGYAEILRDYFPADSKQKEFIQHILTECHHIIALVNRMIDLTKLEQSRFKVNFAPIDILAILKKAILEKETGFEEKKIELETEIHKSLPLVLADEPKIERVFSHILDNALKFTPEGGKVKVETKLHPDSIDFVISDTGVGIKKEHLERIFDDFYQADSSSTRKFGGLGIGLPIIKYIVDTHRGKLWIKSEEVGGTEVVVRLPIME
ncbi:MAG: hybrid sensor histidine kinase/response regulator [Nitrospirota bacterium]